MPIETLEDWNTRLSYCGCCNMPGCPNPVTQSQGQESTVISKGFYGGFFGSREDLPPNTPFSIDLWRRHTNRTRLATVVTPDNYENEAHTAKTEYSGSGTLQSIEDYDNLFSVFQCVSPGYSNNIVTTTGGGGDRSETYYSRSVDTDPYEQTSTYNWTATAQPADNNFSVNSTGSGSFPSYSNTTNETYTATRSILGALNEVRTYAGTMTWIQWLSAAESEATITNTEICWGVVNDSSPIASRTIEIPVGFSVEGSLNKRHARFRFQIPSSHTGPYFKITYDIAEFPTDVNVSPSFISEDNVVQWTGPGTGGESDPSWLTPWVEIEPPTEPGQRRVVNIRYICYHGTKYGVKPQVTGEAFTLPDPPPP